MPEVIDALELGLGEAMVAVVRQAAGLDARVGMADGKFAAYVAAMVQPPSLLPIQIVPPGEGAAFLASLPIDDLPVSVEMRRRLRLFGLQSLGDLGRLPQGAVTAQFGAEGARAWELAHGVDRTPIVPYRAPTSVTERLALLSAVETLDVLIAAAKRLLERALGRPASRGRAARGIRLRAHLDDGRVWEREVTFREPIGGGVSFSTNGRMFLALRQKIESGVSPSSAFVEVELTLLDLCGESAVQESLFQSRRGRRLERVVETARQLKSRYGKPMLAKVVEVEPWSRIPERRFALIDFDP
jgi:nucleotidyltransferase/DNA polymerase involved in DNA repair